MIEDIYLVHDSTSHPPRALSSCQWVQAGAGCFSSTKLGQMEFDASQKYFHQTICGQIRFSYERVKTSHINYVKEDRHLSCKKNPEVNASCLVWWWVHVHQEPKLLFTAAPSPFTHSSFLMVQVICSSSSRQAHILASRMEGDQDTFF